MLCCGCSDRAVIVVDVPRRAKVESLLVKRVNFHREDICTYQRICPTNLTVVALIYCSDSIPATDT